MAFSSDGSAFTKVTTGIGSNKAGSFSRITDVHEEEISAVGSSYNITQGPFGRSSVYSTSSMRTKQNITSSVFASDSLKSTSKKVKTVTSTKTITKKQFKTIPTNDQNTTNSEESKKDEDVTEDTKKDDEMSKGLDVTGGFFKAKFKSDFDAEDFFRSANSRFSMRNLNDTSGLWNFDIDEGASLFPDFFPKNDAATKLSFETTWRAVSPTREYGLAKQAIKNCAWEDEERKNENKSDAKKIVNSWMQFFGHINAVKDG